MTDNTSLFRLPPIGVPVVDQSGSLSPAYRAIFNQQIFPTINSVVTTQNSAVQTSSSTVSQALLADSTVYTPTVNTGSSSVNGTYATQAWVTSQGYITYITGAMVISALGYTPLSTTGTAANSLELGGQLPSYYQTALTFPLSVTLGGTGESTAFTQGSFVFAGASGIYTQDNANAYYNPTGYAGMPNFELGPRASQPIDAAYEFYVTSGMTAHFHNTNTTQSSTGGVTVGLMYAPTGASVTSGNRVGSFEFGGSINTSDNVSSGAAIRAYTTQNYSATTLGTKLVFQTCSNGSATLATALTIDQDQSATFTNIVTATSFNSITGISSLTPLVDGTASPGSGTVVSLGNHIHPTDTSRLSTSVVSAVSTTNPLVDGTASPGSGTTVSAGNHVHPTDISRAALTAQTFTGTQNFSAGLTTTYATLTGVLNGTYAQMSGAVIFTGNTNYAPGSISYFASAGLFIIAKTGTSYDFNLVTPSYGNIMWVPTGTSNVVFASNVTAATLSTTPDTVATLPPTPSVGMRSFVTNALAPTFGATVVAGGAVGVPVYYDGVSWKVG